MCIIYLFIFYVFKHYYYYYYFRAGKQVTFLTEKYAFVNNIVILRKESRDIKLCTANMFPGHA